MNKHNDGGPAFPVGDGHGHRLQGMTLRDYSAAAALQTEWMGDYSLIEQTRLAYEIADAMLAERAKRKDHTETNFGMKKEAQP